MVIVTNTTHLCCTCLQLFRALMAMDSDNYPECCNAIYVVNNAAAFSTIWTMVKPFVDKGTRDKINVMGSGRHMERKLLEIFDPDMLPSFLGGNLDYEQARQQWTQKMDDAMAEKDKAGHPGAVNNAAHVGS